MKGSLLLSALAGAAMLVAAAETACSSKPTTAAAWKSVCELPRKRDLSAGEGRARIAASLAAARDAAGNPEVRTALEQTAALEPPAAVTALREQAARAGVPSCALADHVERAAVADACRRGDPAACVAGAKLYAAASINPAEEKDAGPRLLELACLHGHQASCPKQAIDPALRARLVNPPAGPDHADVIDRIRDLYAASLETCAAAAKPKPGTTVEVGFAVADGVVAEPTVTSSAAPLQACAGARLAAWAFPGAKNRKYKLVFRIGEIPAGADIMDAVNAARQRAAGMDLGHKPPAGPRVTLLDIAAEHDDSVQTGELWHRYLLSFHNQFEACWRDAVKRDKDTAGGQVIIGARVESGGALDGIKVEETFTPELGKCLAGKVDTWRVPVLDSDAGAKLHIQAWFEVIK